MKLTIYSNNGKHSQIHTSMKYSMKKKLPVMWHPVTTKTHNGNLPLNQLHDVTNPTLFPCHAWTTWFSMHSCYAAGPIPSSKSMYAYYALSHLALAMAYFQIEILLVLLGRKLQLILLVHDPHQLHRALWNSLPSLVLTPPLTLSKSHGSLKNLATILLLVLSTPGSLSTLAQCK